MLRNRLAAVEAQHYDLSLTIDADEAVGIVVEADDYRRTQLADMVARIGFYQSLLAEQEGLSS